MAHAYTPGLKVLGKTVIRKERILPLAGDVLVKEGDAVEAEDVVARTFLPGNVETVNVANILGLPPEDIPKFMLKHEGDTIEEGEVIARMKHFFGLYSSRAISPVKGSIETISSITGQIIVREPPNPVEIDAYFDGEIVAVHGEEGVTVETTGTFIQGIFGIGGETQGEITVVSDSPDLVLADEDITAECTGKIIVGGSLVTATALKKAIQLGVKAVIVGGFHDWDLKSFLGFDLGVAITGHEDLGVTLIITEGFGDMAMAEATFNLLKSREGQQASINGATQIRAGVIRPEIIVPHVEKGKLAASASEEGSNLEVGTRVRAIREPFFGKLGEVTSLPVELQILESEAKVRVLGVRFDDGAEEIIPRANVEIIEAG
jgi:hypothetical protein